MYILCLHIDGHVRLYPYLAVCEGLESCEVNSKTCQQARSADTKLDPSCVSAPLTTNVN